MVERITHGVGRRDEALRVVARRLDTLDAELLASLSADVEPGDEKRERAGQERGAEAQRDRLPAREHRATVARRCLGPFRTDMRRATGHCRRSTGRARAPDGRRRRVGALAVRRVGHDPPAVTQLLFVKYESAGPGMRSAYRLSPEAGGASARISGYLFGAHEDAPSRSHARRAAVPTRAERPGLRE